MNRTHSHRLVVAASGMILAAGHVAVAQQYRPGGDILDRNLQVGSGGKNPRARDVRDQIWFNNQVITGNAPAGRSFRGIVGYTAPNEFRGVTGTDSQYSFLRDSSSGVVVSTGVRPSDALRYQMALTTGQSAPAYLAGAEQALFPSRASVAASGGAVTAQSADAAALRSTSDYLAARALKPTLVGSRVDNSGVEWTATASTLTGLAWLRLNPNLSQVGPVKGAGAGGLAPSSDAPAESVTPGAPTLPEGGGGPKGNLGLTPSGLESRASGFRSSWYRTLTGRDNQGANRLDLAVDTSVGADAVPSRSVAHGQVMDALRTAYRPAAEPAGEPPAGESPVDSELARLRRLLRGEPLLPPSPPAPTPPSAGTSTPGAGDQAATPKAPGAGPDGAPAVPSGVVVPTRPELKPDDPDARPPKREVSPEILRALKALGEKSLDSLTPSVAAQTDSKVYRSHMESGQRAIGEGRYFDAEDRFTRAIAAMPNDPMAKIGRVHAQMGAGLFLSASTNLRRLIQDHPEAAGLRFDAKLAPEAERVTRLAAQLREEIAQSTTGMGLEASLLLAYLGRMTSDQAMTDEGLMAMGERLDPENERDRLLHTTLKGVWGK